MSLFVKVRESDEREVLFVRWLSIGFFLGIAAIMAQPVLSQTSWLVFVQDDLLYYLKVAQSIAHGQGSTFNGLVNTNGYQPLWFVILVLLSFVTENPKAILAFIALINFFAAVLTFWLAKRLLQTTGARPLLTFGLAAWVTLYSVTLFFYGMEVTLTVPLLIGILNLLRNTVWLEKSAWHTFGLGLLLSLMVLSRLDTLILGGLILAGIIVSPSLRALLRTRLLVGLICGLLPLVGYFLINHFLFQTWLPISGMAKQLRFSHAPSLEPWRVFFHLLAGFFLIVLITAFGIFLRIRHSLSTIDRVLFLSFISFPFVYYFILSCLSDWTLWGWYYYPIRTALCISFFIFCSFPPLLRLLERPFVLGFLLLSITICLSLMKWTRQQTDIFAASVEIRDFAVSHPGVYAMGDRAGRVAYLIPNPVVQTEGLMMDREYLRFVERQTPLLEVLGHYKVRYYIATAYEPFRGCFEAAEPSKAGPDSAHMRAEFCEAPVATFTHEGIQTLIYDLSPNTGRARN